MAGDVGEGLEQGERAEASDDAGRGVQVETAPGEYRCRVGRQHHGCEAAECCKHFGLSGWGAARGHLPSKGDGWQPGGSFRRLNVYGRAKRRGVARVNELGSLNSGRA